MDMVLLSLPQRIETGAESVILIVAYIFHEDKIVFAAEPRLLQKHIQLFADAVNNGFPHIGEYLEFGFLRKAVPEPVGKLEADLDIVF